MSRRDKTIVGWALPYTPPQQQQDDDDNCDTQIRPRSELPLSLQATQPLPPSPVSAGPSEQTMIAPMPSRPSIPSLPPPPPPVPAHGLVYMHRDTAHDSRNDAIKLILPSPPPQLSRTRAARGSVGALPSTGTSPRVHFVRATYVHLFLALCAFGGLLYLLMTNAFLIARVSAPFTRFALAGRWHWGAVLGAFVVSSWLADYYARHATSKVVQYLGLAFYICCEAVIFVPLLAIVEWKTQALLSRGGAEPHIIRDSAFITAALFFMLTFSAFFSKRDFSYLRSGLVMATGAAASLIALSLMFGFNLGLAFSAGMVVLAGAYILFQTSEVLRTYKPGQHVAASLALFSSVALMFWYVIRIMLRART